VAAFWIIMCILGVRLMGGNQPSRLNVSGATGTTGASAPANTDGKSGAKPAGSKPADKPATGSVPSDKAPAAPANGSKPAGK
jgi:hypothetical protein